MTMKAETYKGLTITSARHPTGYSRVFPKGIFYGEVNGFSVTAPCSSEESGIRDAKRAVDSGSALATVKTHVQCLEGYIRNGYQVEESQKQLDRWNALLDKLIAPEPRIKDPRL